MLFATADYLKSVMDQRRIHTHTHKNIQKQVSQHKNLYS